MSGRDCKQSAKHGADPIRENCLLTDVGRVKLRPPETNADLQPKQALDVCTGFDLGIKTKVVPKNLI